MKLTRLPAAMLFVAITLVASAASASTSRWEQAEGGRVRLVTTGLPDANGRLRGVIEIQLKPGWKTYWRDPGAAGVPPSFDVSASSNVTSATLDFPAPQRHFEGDLPWAGYDHSVGLPVTFELRPGPAKPIEASVFLGVCEAICIPLQAALSVDPTEAPDAADDAARVANAFDALPRPATDAVGVSFVRAEGGKAVFQIHGPTGDADLFLAGDGYGFGVPERFQQDGHGYLKVPTDRPATIPSNGVIHYTLVTSAGAVSGTLPAF